jgi:hypothetical protein
MRHLWGWRTHESVACILLPAQVLAAFMACNCASRAFDGDGALERVDCERLQSAIVPELSRRHRGRDEHGIGGQRQACEKAQLARRHVKDVVTVGEEKRLSGGQGG